MWWPLKCSHEFYIDEIEFTDYKMPEQPAQGAGYAAWDKYFKNLYTCGAIKKRVKCNCLKCGETVFAHCGLELGTLRRKNK